MHDAPVAACSAAKSRGEPAARSHTVDEDSQVAIADIVMKPKPISRRNSTRNRLDGRKVPESCSGLAGTVDPHRASSLRKGSKSVQLRALVRDDSHDRALKAQPTTRRWAGFTSTGVFPRAGSTGTSTPATSKIVVEPV